MNRIVIHWTGGTHQPNATDLAAYHRVIAGNGGVMTGNHPIEANRVLRNPSDARTYAAHTARLNTGSIGVALAAMHGAVERPFTAGQFPITEAQVAALVRLCSELCREYGIPVTRETVLTHAEVQPTLGVPQRAKWDITWVPGMSAPGDPVEVGDQLRARIAAAMSPPAPAATLPAWLARLAALFTRRT